MTNAVEDYMKGEKRFQLRHNRETFKPRDYMPLEHSFLRKLVLVEVEENTVVLGKLIHYSVPEKEGHIPPILIILNAECQKVLVRNYRSIKTLKP